MKYLLYLFLTIIASLTTLVLFSWIISMLLRAMNEPDTAIVIGAFIGIAINIGALTMSILCIWYWFFKLTFKSKV